MDWTCQLRTIKLCKTRNTGVCFWREHIRNRPNAPLLHCRLSPDVPVKPRGAIVHLVFLDIHGARLPPASSVLGEPSFAPFEAFAIRHRRFRGRADLSTVPALSIKQHRRTVPFSRSRRGDGHEQGGAEAPTAVREIQAMIVPETHCICLSETSSHHSSTTSQIFITKRLPAVSFRR
jgi:hypothetical protein